MTDEEHVKAIQAACDALTAACAAAIKAGLDVTLYADESDNQPAVPYAFVSRRYT